MRFEIQSVYLLIFVRLWILAEMKWVANGKDLDDLEALTHLSKMSHSSEVPDYQKFYPLKYENDPEFRESFSSLLNKYSEDVKQWALWNYGDVSSKVKQTDINPFLEIVDKDLFNSKVEIPGMDADFNPFTLYVAKKTFKSKLLETTEYSIQVIFPSLFHPLYLPQSRNWWLSQSETLDPSTKYRVGDLYLDESNEFKGMKNSPLYLSVPIPLWVALKKTVSRVTTSEDFFYIGEPALLEQISEYGQTSGKGSVNEGLKPLKSFTKKLSDFLKEHLELKAISGEHSNVLSVHRINFEYPFNLSPSFHMRRKSGLYTQSGDGQYIVAVAVFKIASYNDLLAYFKQTQKPKEFGLDGNNLERYNYLVCNSLHNPTGLGYYFRLESKNDLHSKCKKVSTDELLRNPGYPGKFDSIKLKPKFNAGESNTQWLSRTEEDQKQANLNFVNPCAIVLCPFIATSEQTIRNGITANHRPIALLHGKGLRSITRYQSLRVRMPIIKSATGDFPNMETDSDLFEKQATLSYYWLGFPIDKVKVSEDKKSVAGIIGDAIYFMEYNSEDESFMNVRNSAFLPEYVKMFKDTGGVVYAHSMGNPTLVQSFYCHFVFNQRTLRVQNVELMGGKGVHEGDDTSLVPLQNDKMFGDESMTETCNFQPYAYESGRPVMFTKNTFHKDPREEDTEASPIPLKRMWYDLAGPILGSKAASALRKMICTAQTYNERVVEVPVKLVRKERCSFSNLHLSGENFHNHKLAWFSATNFPPAGVICGVTTRSLSDFKATPAGWAVSLVPYKTEPNDILVSVKECMGYFTPRMCNLKSSTDSVKRGNFVYMTKLDGNHQDSATLGFFPKYKGFDKRYCPSSVIYKMLSRDKDLNLFKKRFRQAPLMFSLCAEAHNGRKLKFSEEKQEMSIYELCGLQNPHGNTFDEKWPILDEFCWYDELKNLPFKQAFDRKFAMLPKPLQAPGTS